MNPEQILQINVVNWFHEEFPELADDLHHFANERKCSYHEGRILKRMGVKKGVHDLFLAFAVNGYHGLWLELKTEKGRLTPEQKEFRDRKNKRGYLAVTANEFERAKDLILYYLYSYTINRKNEISP